MVVKPALWFDCEVTKKGQLRIFPNGNGFDDPKDREVGGYRMGREDALELAEKIMRLCTNMREE